MKFKAQRMIGGTLMAMHLAMPVHAESPYPCLQNPKSFSASAIPGEASWTAFSKNAEAPLLARTASNALLQVPNIPARVPLQGGDIERPMRAGEPLDLLQASIARLVPEWQTDADGTRVARVALRSPGAGALRVAIQIRPAAAVTLRAQGSGSAEVLRLSSDALPRDARETLWTPITEGEVQEIEIRLHSSAAARPQILMRQVSVFDQHPARAAQAASRPSALGKVLGKSLEKAATCSDEVACLPDAPAHFINAARSVVRLTMTRSGSSYNCTGTLINDTNFATQVPYVLTAAHCVDSAATAATVNAFFFYQAATCGASALNGAVQIGSGAHLLYVNTSTDVALLRLNEPAPAGAFFSGWDPTPLTEGSCMVMIHHPDGGPKAYSVGTTLPVSLESDLSSDHMLVTWRAGSSTGGSSGAPMHALQNNEFLVHGLLHGGRALCGFSGQMESPLNRDFFARLDKDAPGLRAVLQRDAAPLFDYSDVWVPTDELGWGMAVYQGDDDRMLIAFYTQDADGIPIWYLSLGGRWTSTTRFEGDMALVNNSPALGPYDPSRLSTTPAGSLVINFATQDTAQMTFRIGQGSRTKNMKRFRF